MKVYDVIRNETGLLKGGFGSTSVLVWKFSGEDFNDNAQLIVSESEEAIFVRDGIAVATFGGGRYTLNTNNHPFIGRLRRLLSGGVSAFHSRVYFVNVDHKVELFWGTDSPIQLRDPVVGLQTSVQARGSYSIQVADAKKFLIKLLGTNVQMLDQQQLVDYFRSAFSQNIRGEIARYVRDSRREILEITNDIEALAEQLRPRLEPVLDEYGVRLVNFYIAAIDIPANDPNRQVLEMAIAQKQAKMQEAEGNKAAMGILGPHWARHQSATILSDLANNPGGPGIASGGGAAGLGLAAGSPVNELVHGMLTGAPQFADGQVVTPVGRNRSSRFSPAVSARGTVAAGCPACHEAALGGAKFCPECGASLASKARACTGCGRSMQDTDRFCPECGTQNV